MMYFKNSFLLSILCLSLCWGCQTRSEERPADRPNIVLILADDMGYGDIAALNADAKVHTPVLDSLIRAGRSFTEAHTSAAICTPTRYALLTGRYSFRLGYDGVATGYSAPLIEYERETLASLLKKAGYTTACIGKWHLGLAWAPEDTARPVYTQDAYIPENLNVDYSRYVGGVNEIGFDYAFISPGGNNIAPFTYVKNGRVTEQPTEYIAPRIKGHTYETRRNGGDKAPGYAFDQSLKIVTNEAVAYLEAIKAAEAPFFLYLPLTAPHFPWKPDTAFAGTSAAGSYGDFVQEIDYRVGEVLETIRDLDMDENTLIIFTADNGGAFEPYFEKYQHEMNKGRRGQKHQIWEGGVRVPFIACWPGVIPAGSVAEQPFSLVDMLATFSGLTGQPSDPKYAEDSYDVSALLLGDNEASRQGAMINQAVQAEALSILEAGWKLIPYGYGNTGLEPAPAGKPPGQLYHLAEDSMETRNVYEQYPEKVAALRTLLEKYRKQGYSRRYDPASR